MMFIWLALASTAAGDSFRNDINCYDCQDASGRDCNLDNCELSDGTQCKASDGCDVGTTDCFHGPGGKQCKKTTGDEAPCAKCTFNGGGNKQCTATDEGKDWDKEYCYFTGINIYGQVSPSGEGTVRSRKKCSNVMIDFCDMTPGCKREFDREGCRVAIANCVKSNCQTDAECAADIVQPGEMCWGGPGTYGGVCQSFNGCYKSGAPFNVCTSDGVVQAPYREEAGSGKCYTSIANENYSTVNKFYEKRTRGVTGGQSTYDYVTK